MSTQTFSETRKFRLKILACMLKARWLARYGSVIKPEYFEREDEHNLAEAILEFWNTYRHPPDDSDDVLALLDSNHSELVYTVFLGVDEWDLSLASDMAIQFSKEQAAKIAVLSSLKDIERGELGKVVERLQEAMRVGTDVSNLGLDLKGDIDAWLSKSQAEKLPTGMIHLDIALDGGLATGELGVFLAPPNYGKSMALINVGHGAMGPLSRCNVVHFSTEMSVDIVAKRYATRSVFRFPSRNIATTSEYKADFEYISNLMLPGNVRIFHVNGNINVLRAHIDTLIDSGYIPDLIIVDYGDEIDALRKRDDAYTELGEIFKSLRDLGIEYNCPVWTATQATRASLNKEVITMANISDSIKKAGKSDAIVAICQTREEEDNDQCRLFLAKLRDGKSRSMIQAKFYKEQQAIITTGFV